MKVLIIRFSSIGDIVLSSGLVRCLKNQLPGVEIHYCTKKQFLPLVQYSPHIDRVHTLEKGRFGELLQSLRAEDFDWVIDIHRKLRSIALTILLQRPSLALKKYTLERWWLIWFKQNNVPARHIVDHYIDAVAPLGVRNDGQGLEFYIDPSIAHPGTALGSWPQSAYSVYVIGGSKTTKIAPPDTMIRVIEKMGDCVVLVGGKEDAERAESIVHHFRQRSEKQIYNTCGLLSLMGSARVLQESRYVVSHDTGMMHIAVALGKKVFALWGPTLPFLFGPYSATAEVIMNTDLDCRPCSKSGTDRCPRGHFKCMKELPLDRFEFAP